MTGRPRIVLLSCVLALACSSPGSDLFSPSGEGPSPSGGSGGSGGNAPGGSGAGAVTAGGAGTMAGAGSGAAPAAGSGGTGQQSGEGGEQATGMAGASDGEGGSPADPPDLPVCGNGKLEGDEECDDMGQAGDDGCTADCQVDCSDFGEDAVESADHHCYNGYDEATFEAAQADCVERGAHLVTIASAAENELVVQFVASSKFIGGFEMVDVMVGMDGTYQWVTGEPFEYENWSEDQPDRDGSRCNGFTGPMCYEHCAAMDGEGAWMDQRCDQEDGYVCEWEPAGE